MTSSGLSAALVWRAAVLLHEDTTATDYAWQSRGWPRSTGAYWRGAPDGPTISASSEKHVATGKVTNGADSASRQCQKPDAAKSDHGGRFCRAPTGGVICHQRLIREELAASQPRPALTSLEACRVEPISRREAASFIVQYEWLGNCGKPSLCVGARAPGGDLFGVACFGNGVGADVRARLGGRVAICLERGACAHWAHPHASSWLITRACKLVATTAAGGVLCLL